jgi:putative ABC transport system permease protein
MDLKFALRSLRKNASFTALAVFVMALGIGANTAVFTVVNTVLLKPLAYREPDRIVKLFSLWKKSGGQGQVSAPDFDDWRHQSSAFDAMAYYAAGEASAIIGSNAEYIHTATVTPEFFRVFQIEPVRGRLFTAEEEKPGSGGALLISHAYWQRHFAGNTNALGAHVRMFDKPLTIVGVLPAGFHFPDKTDLWFPANTIFNETEARSAHNYEVIGRLKPGVTLAQAQAQMTAIGTRLEQQYPDSNEGKSVAVIRLRDEMVRNIRLTLYVLLGAVGVVLLIACANTANLLLAKATARRREIAIRAAVGASRSRIVRQLITESLVLALVAGSFGLAFAIWGTEALKAIAPAGVPRLAETKIDVWVLVFTFGVTVAASLVFGLVPALETSRVDLNEALKQGAARTGLGGRGGRMRAALVVVEVALSVILVAGAGLLIRSFHALANVDVGFRPEKVLVMETSVPSSDLESARRATRFYKTLLAGVVMLPGVAAAGATRTPPGRVSSNGGYWIDRLPAPEGLSVTAPNAVLSVVAPGTFAALGIPLKGGRDFQNGDTYDAPFVAIVNQALARKSFPNQDPIGHSILCGLDSPKAMKIVGVAGDIRQYGPAAQPQPEIYMPYEQHPIPSTALSVVVRTSAGASAINEALRQKVRERSPDVPVRFTTMEAELAENVAAPRFRTLLLGIFAGLAVCLAMAGIYGVMAYVVSQQSSEIGLRMALGASSVDILRLVLGRSLTLAGIGLALGFAGAIAATRLLTSMLFEITPTDPFTYAVVALLLGIIALVASYVPARRAINIDPLLALRQE